MDVPTDAARVLLDVVRRFREEDLEFMVVGAFAVMAHGRPRTTADIDIAVHLRFSERDRVRPLLEQIGDGEVSERSDPDWGKRLVTVHPSGLDLEVFFVAGHPFYDREFERKVTGTLRGEEIPLISPEGLILRKLVDIRKRSREDRADAFSIARVQGGKLNLAYLREHCAPHRVCDLVEEIGEAIEQTDG